MDTAVAFVQAYLHINGYFTVTEYPVVEAIKRGGYRAATDLDILAIRFPWAGRLVPMHGKKDLDTRFEPDPELYGDVEYTDMIIGEVKEGRAELNHGARNPVVLRSVLTRFGCCREEDVGSVVDGLLHKGEANIGDNHRFRLIAFGTSTEEPLGYPCRVISLGHVINFTRDYLREHWEILRQAQFKDTALAALMMLEKAERHTSDPEPDRAY